jgi:hypothetical protein
MKAAANPQPGDDPNFSTRLLINLLRRQFSKLDRKALGDPEEYVRRLHHGFNPKDAIEELLAGSIILTYGRIAHLTHLAAKCKDESDLLNIFAAADRTANSLRRQLISLATYRTPTLVAQMVEDEKWKKMGESKEFTNAFNKWKKEHPNEEQFTYEGNLDQKSTNELGFNHEKETLPVDEKRVAINSGQQSATPSMDPIDRPKNR